MHWLGVWEALFDILFGFSDPYASWLFFSGFSWIYLPDLDMLELKCGGVL
jgi:hypothetical protein